LGYVTEISDLLEKRKQNIKETKVRMANAKEKLQLKIQVLESNQCNMLLDIGKCKDGLWMSSGTRNVYICQYTTYKTYEDKAALLG
jgi:hypothetical protein